MVNFSSGGERMERDESTTVAELISASVPSLKPLLKFHDNSLDPRAESFFIMKYLDYSCVKTSEFREEVYGAIFCPIQCLGIKKMMEELWTKFCREPDCLSISGQPCTFGSTLASRPFLCVNHSLTICLNTLLLVMLLFNMFQKTSMKTGQVPARFKRLSLLQTSSVIVSGLLGLAYLGLGIWVLEENLRKSQTALPLNWWIVVLFQGLTWWLVGLMVSVRGKYSPRAPLRLLSILDFLFAGIICVSSVFVAIVNKEASIKIALDVLSFPGSFLLLLCAHKGYTYEDGDEIANGDGIYAPLNCEANGSIKTDSHGHVTGFAKAGFFSKMSFWWLNSLMKRGREKTLEDEDIPKLRKADGAEECYL